MQGFGGHGPSGIRKENTVWFYLKENPLLLSRQKVCEGRNEGLPKGLSWPPILSWKQRILFLFISSEETFFHKRLMLPDEYQHT